MYSWQDIKDWLSVEPDKRSKLERTLEITQAYNYYLSKHNPNEIIVQNYFSGIHADRDAVMMLNSFPYDLQDNLIHQVIWFNPNLPIFDQEYIVKALTKNLKCPLAWANPAKMQSVNLVPHYQVISKK